jgi:hypothetical protein
MGPQVLLGSGKGLSSGFRLTKADKAPKVQDEDLKKLLMSWYYAGKTFCSSSSPGCFEVGGLSANGKLLRVLHRTI